MKHNPILLTALFAVFTISISHAAELSSTVSAANMHLRQDYKNYLKQQIEHYKNTPISVASLIDMGTIITGTNLRVYIRDTQNDEGNTLLHIAVTKEDLPVIQDIFAFSSITHTNAQGKKPLDLAIEQLHPKSIKPRNNNQISILEMFVESIAKRAYIESDKTECLKKIIALELACKNNPVPPFTIIPNANLLQKLIPNEHKTNAEQFLASLYKQATHDETGNTFAHVCVNQEDPDELFKLVCAGRISDAVNKQGLNSLECALCNFREFTTHPQRINTKNAMFNRVRCCYFILYYYYTNNSTDSCCEKHKMPKNNIKDL